MTHNVPSRQVNRGREQSLMHDWLSHCSLHRSYCRLQSLSHRAASGDESQLSLNRGRFWTNPWPKQTETNANRNIATFCNKEYLCIGKNNAEQQVNFHAILREKLTSLEGHLGLQKKSAFFFRNLEVYNKNI